MVVVVLTRAVEQIVQAPELQAATRRVHCGGLHQLMMNDQLMNYKQAQAQLRRSGSLREAVESFCWIFQWWGPQLELETIWGFLLIIDTTLSLYESKLTYMYN